MRKKTNNKRKNIDYLARGVVSSRESPVQGNNGKHKENLADAGREPPRPPDVPPHPEKRLQKEQDERIVPRHRVGVAGAGRVLEDVLERTDGEITAKIPGRQKGRQPKQGRAQTEEHKQNVRQGHDAIREPSIHGFQGGEMGEAEVVDRRGGCNNENASKNYSRSGVNKRLQEIRLVLR